MGKGVFLLVVGVFCVNFLVSGLNLKTRKQCCDLGANYSSNGFDCRTFQPKMAGDLSGEKQCLNMVDVCCKTRYKEQQCSAGSDNAKEGKSCPTEDGEKKDCCESCQAGIDAGIAKDPCNGLGLGPPFDSAFNECCEESSKILTTSTTTTTVATKKSTTSVLDVFNEIDDFNSNTHTENICDSDVCAQICEPVADSFKCDCFKGYILMDDGISCKPQKRSLQKSGRCIMNNPCDHDCTDTGTAIKCSCREGYELAEDNRTCGDIDECERNLHDCTSVNDCINEIGTYSCYDPILPGENETVYFEDKCPPGYHYNFEKLVCDDIDECQFDLICIPPKVCKNTIGSFLCEGNDTPQCPPGFHFKEATQTCTDIDECLTGENDCNKESQFCLNTKGNYTCVDKAFKSTCPPGFKINPFTHSCEDINECEEQEGLCADSEKCVNESGGHTCIPLQDGEKIKSTTMSTTSTTPEITTVTSTQRPDICPKGYSYYGERNVCEDVNECQLGTHDCEVAERCDNTIGSYHCSRIFGCGTGYTLNGNNGLCEDDDECALGTNNCKALGPNFRCRNTLGSYRCEPVRPKYKSTTPSTTTTATTTTTTTTEKPQPSEIPRPYQPPYYHPQPQYTYPTFSYPTLPPKIQHSVPNETVSGTLIPLKKYPSHIPNSTNRISGTLIPFPTRTTPSSTSTIPQTPPPRTPVRNTIVFNTPPGTLPYYSPRWTTSRPVERSTYNVIMSQRKQCLPGYKMNYKGECEDINECESNPCGKLEKCLNFNGRYECAAPMQCKMGFELNDSGDQCIDINECSRGTHKCQPTQICKNYQGYYTCECPPGHHLNKVTDQCEDLDECKMFRPCRSISSKCINTKGSFRCDCNEGFQRKSASECGDIDECRETPGLCQHNCVNIWGTYRCSCNQGFILNSDNRTCTDIDECERFKDKRLCIGTCKNVPGSYACECPPGYKLGSDGRVCIDVDECQENNVCLKDEVCLNTRGSYKCYRINCPPNYVKDTGHKSRCKRLQSLCDPRDYQCLLMPEQYTYQYITLVSNLPLLGEITLFRIKGPEWYSSKAQFSMKLLDVSCPQGVARANEHYFRKVNDQFNSMALHLVRSIQGPQEIKLQIEMKLFRGNTIIGNAVVYIIIVVSEYAF
ncbi:hypothetical protein JTB14_018232 [Gonioctena quinquepunctata]|nr:hypothetical protein JTB14_018232 [Gonioctena quinquepunctata]